jgi:hypothetical protein
MSKILTVNENYNFNVIKEPLFCKDGAIAEDFYATRREDTGAVLGVVGKNYQIVQNSDLLDVVSDTFNKKGYDFELTPRIIGNGEKMIASYRFKNITKEVKKGDIVGFGINVQNSFDGVWKVVENLNLLRLICANGMTKNDQQFSLTQRHTNKLDIKLIGDALEKSMEAFLIQIEQFQIMAKREVTQTQGERIIANLVNKSAFSERTSEKIIQVWRNPAYSEDTDRNIWNVYNAITQIARDDKSIITSNKMTSQSLRLLSNAMEDSTIFDSLVALPA